MNQRNCKIRATVFVFIAIVLQIVQLCVNLPLYPDASELCANIPLQAASHVTSLGLLVAVGALLFSLVINRYMQEYDRFTEQYKLELKESKKEPLFSFDASMGGVLIISSMGCFGVAGYICALLSGYNFSREHAVLPYAILTNVYILYTIGFSLIALGTLYGARLFHFGTDKSMYLRWVGLGLVVISLSVVHQPINLQFQMIDGTDRDWLLWLAWGLLFLSEPVNCWWNPRKRGKGRHMIFVMAAVMAAILGLGCVLSSAIFLNMKAINEYTQVPAYFQRWYKVFYVVVGAWMAFAIGMFGEVPDQGAAEVEKLAS